MLGTNPINFTPHDAVFGKFLRLISTSMHLLNRIAFVSEISIDSDYFFFYSEIDSNFFCFQPNQNSVISNQFARQRLSSTQPVVVLGTAGKRYIIHFKNKIILTKVVVNFVPIRSERKKPVEKTTPTPRRRRRRRYVLECN